MKRDKKVWALIGASAVVLAGAAVVIAAEVRKFRKSMKKVAEAIDADGEYMFACDYDCARASESDCCGEQDEEN